MNILDIVELLGCMYLHNIITCDIYNMSDMSFSESNNGCFRGLLTLLQAIKSVVAWY